MLMVLGVSSNVSSDVSSNKCCWANVSNLIPYSLSTCVQQTFAPLLLLCRIRNAGEQALHCCSDILDVLCFPGKYTRGMQGIVGASVSEEERHQY